MFSWGDRVSPLLWNASFLRVVAAFVGVASIVLALLNGGLAWGLWTGKGWAWTAALVFNIIAIIFSILGLPWTFPSFILDAIIIYYLTRTHVKDYFRRGETSAKKTEPFQYPPSTPPTAQQQTAEGS